MNSLLLAQTSVPDANLAALVKRLVRGGLGIIPGSSASLLLLVIGWLVVLASVTALLQRDRKRWLRGLVDVRGHFEQLGAGLEILRRNKRPLSVLLAASVLSWSGWSLRVWQESSSKDELEAMLAVYDNSAARFAGAHAWGAAIVPLRCLTGLGDLLLLVLGASMLLFARTAQYSKDLRSRVRAAENILLKRRLGTVWVALIVMAAYRILVVIVAPDTAPMADCMYINAVMFPLLLLAADATLLSWVLAEFGRALSDHFDWQPDDTVSFVRTIPAAAIVCVLLNPGRYLLVTCAIWQAQFSSANWPASRWTPILWTCTIAQVFGLMWFTLPGVLVVVRGGGLAHKFHAYLNLVRRVGGQLVGFTILSLLLTFLSLFPFYYLFGAMQRETWSLLGAASYGYYSTLLLGIILLAGATQLAYQELGIEQVEGPKAVLLPAAVLPDLQASPPINPGQRP